MQVGEIVELVFIRVNGNRPSTDSTILRSDIRFLLPAAINYALDAAYNVNIESERDRDMPAEFYVFRTASLNTGGARPKFDLINPVVPLKGAAGLRFVQDDLGNYYTPVPDYAMYNLDYYSSIVPCGWYRQMGNSVELWGGDPDAASVSYHGLEKVDGMADTDEAPIQAGMEPMVMDLLVDWFTGAKQMPYDPNTEGRDLVNVAR